MGSSEPPPPPPPPPPPAPPPATTPDPGSGYPARLTITEDTQHARWGPLVQWLLAVPHWFISTVLLWVSGVLAFISWFVVLFTGKLPEGMANFQCMSLRYLARTYTYGLGLLAPFEPYAPFEFATTPADPTTYP